MLNRRNDYETGETVHLIESDLMMRLRDDLNRMKKVRSYKGKRHEVGLPVRGQRTKSTFRKGTSVGVRKRRARPSIKIIIGEIYYGTSKKIKEKI